jgi:hypothetical protein
MGLSKIVSDWRAWCLSGAAVLAIVLTACGGTSASAPAAGSAGSGTSQSASASTPQSTQPSGSAAAQAASSAPATPVQAQAPPAGNDACTILTTAEMSAILGGAPVQGATASVNTSGPGYICNFGSGPVVSATGATQYHVFSLIQLEYTPTDEATLWSTYMTDGSPIPGDKYGVRSLHGSDAVKLPDGRILSASVGFSGTTGGVISGSPAALVSALDAAAARNSG